jgi:hypothetical protein
MYCHWQSLYTQSLPFLFEIARYAQFTCKINHSFINAFSNSVWLVLKCSQTFLPVSILYNEVEKHSKLFTRFTNIGVRVTVCRKELLCWNGEAIQSLMHNMLLFTEQLHGEGRMLADSSLLLWAIAEFHTPFTMNPVWLISLISLTFVSHESSH